VFYVAGDKDSRKKSGLSSEVIRIAGKMTFLVNFFIYEVLR